MEYSNLLIHNNDGIITLTINRPKALNALNQQTLNEIKHFFENTKNDTSIKGIILTGAGEKSFIAGADIKEFLSLDQGSGTQMAQNGHDIFFLIERFPKPVIAAVNGFALGGGCELAMACHMRIASPNAKFGQPEVNLGIIPGYGGTQRLIQLIGKGKAIELLMTADMINAEEALRLGLVNHVVAQEELIEKSSKIIATIATKAPVAIAKIVECVNAYYNNEPDGFMAEIAAFGRTAGTADFQEGAAAFIEKRKANFKGA